MRIRRLRQLSQALFLALFLLLLWGTEVQEGAVRLRWPVRLFLEADPLVALLSALAAHALVRGLLWALAILIPTFFLGRFFCGWICPLGTLNHLFSSVRSERKRGRALIDSNRYRPWQRLKYYILAGGLAAAVCGSAALGWLDPIALAVRSFALALYPTLNWALEPVLKTGVFSFTQPHFRQTVLFAAILAVILLANLRVTRFFCRALCPLGALLGVASRWSVLRLDKRGERCGDCNRCLLHCQGGDDPIPGVRWHKAECHLCLNCVADCPEGGLAFRLQSADRAAEAAAPDAKRRALLTGLVVGAAAVPLFRAGAAPLERRDRLVRPPGALEEPDFLARCIRCGECMRTCPANAIQPALFEGGAEGLWTPVVVPRVGYCQPSCVLCGQACPTGAIRELTPREKGWRGEAGADRKPVRIGTAFYDRGRCLPWAMGIECIVCQEWCPTSPKAIYLHEAEVTDSAGRTRKLRQPYLDPDICVGCGACEFACPVRDRAAVYVTSVGESRSRTNQLTLGAQGQAAASAASLPESAEAPGWSKTGPIRTFGAASLWQYLDGGADRYVHAGVIKTLTARYNYRGQFDAVADLHVFRGAGGPASVFDSEPATGSQPVRLGDAARLYGASLVFRRDACLVRVVAYDPPPGTSAALVELARAIERRVPAPPSGTI
ncbi:MAG: DUF6599 family protein [Bryobacteraceae bacterium]